MPDKSVRDEIAELTSAVRELRDNEVASELASLRAEVEKLRAEKSAHHCTGCSCMHIHYWPNYQTYLIPGAAPQPTHIWYGTVTSGSGGSGGTSTMPDNYTVTAVN